jgi:hypothetical protein
MSLASALREAPAVADAFENVKAEVMGPAHS